jgi:hypothetical protein
MTVKNTLKQEELIEYLRKHQTEIINYKKQKEVEKTIGSGRAEKGVDMIVAYRQKNKPIAWSEKGRYALSTLRAEALNLAKAASRTLNITATTKLRSLLKQQ